MFSCFGTEGSSRGRGGVPKRGFRNAFGRGTSGRSVPMEREEVSEEEFRLHLVDFVRTDGERRAEEDITRTVVGDEHLRALVEEEPHTRRFVDLDVVEARTIEARTIEVQEESHPVPERVWVDSDMMVTRRSEMQAAEPDALIGEFIGVSLASAFFPHAKIVGAELQLSLLPERTTTERDCERSCNVCLEMYKKDSVVRTLPCFHFFHKECIDPWLLPGRNCCPVCKGKVWSGLRKGFEWDSGTLSLGSSTSYRY